MNNKQKYENKKKQIGSYWFLPNAPNFVNVYIRKFIHMMWMEIFNNFLKLF